jgi:hypothetical protein
MKQYMTPFDQLMRNIRPKALAAIAREGGPARDFCYLIDGDEMRLVRTESLADDYDLQESFALARTLRRWQARLTCHEFVILRIRGESMFDIGAARVAVSEPAPQMSAT